VLEKDGEDQLDQLCEKWQTVTRVEGDRNILYILQYNETKEGLTGFVTSCIGTAFYVTEGKIEETRRWGTRHKQLVDVFKKKHCNLVEEALGHILWRTPFGRGYEPDARQTT
jgi:hypothetical protein